MFDTYKPDDVFYDKDTSYVLCYQYEHVFPMLVERIDELKDYIKGQRNKYNLEGKCFAVYPSYLYTLSLEYRLWQSLGRPEHPLRV